MNLQERMLSLYKYPALRPMAYYALKALGIDFPVSVQFGSGLRLEHGAVGLVVHPRTVIGENVKLYQGVTIGRSDIWRNDVEPLGRVRIGDNSVLASGCCVLFRSGHETNLASGTVVGANSVVLHSTTANAIVAGAPAKPVGDRSERSE